MINIEQVIRIQEKLIDEFGGIKGIRDKSLLDSALNRAFSTFDGKLPYKSVTDRASVLLESLVKNHAFLDGNKRIAYFVYRAYLLSNGFDIEATQDEKYELVISVAESKIELKELINWTNTHIVEL
jgi:death-on-curing protein